MPEDYKKFVTPDEFMAEDQVEYAEVPGFKKGEFIRIRSLTAADVAEWSEAQEGESKRAAGLGLIIKSWVDKDGKSVATEAHLPALRGKSHRITNTIVRAILDLNGMHVKTGEVKND